MPAFCCSRLVPESRTIRPSSVTSVAVTRTVSPCWEPLSTGRPTPRRVRGFSMRKLPVYTPACSSTTSPLAARSRTACSESPARTGRVAACAHAASTHPPHTQSQGNFMQESSHQPSQGAQRQEQTRTNEQVLEAHVREHVHHAGV